MVIIFDNGNFWIDSIFVARVSVAASTTLQTTHPLVREGSIMAIAVSVDSDDGRVTGSIRNPDNSEITFAQVSSEVELIRRNLDAGGAHNIGIKCVIFMRQ